MLAFPLLAVIATIVLIVLIQKGALGEYAWIGWLVLVLIWFAILFQYVGPHFYIGGRVG